jgi:TolB-like protein
MKRCPECRRDYHDDTLSFCLADGSELVYGIAENEPATAVLSEPPALVSGQSGDDSPTRAQPHTTDQTAMFYAGAEAEPQKNLGNSSERHSLSAHRAAKPLAGLVAIALFLIGGFFGYRYLSSANSKQIDSIAVMPFVNDSGNAEMEYLSDGMTETLIGSLSQIAGLNVKARSSVFRYKGKDTDARTIGKELGVRAILNGRFVQRGDQLTLSLELIDAENENLIWSDKYDRRQADLVNLQSQIARDVSGKLKLKLSSADQLKLAKNYTTDPEVYRLYLQGRYYWNKRNFAEVSKAIPLFQQAVEKDPNFALGYVGLADSNEDVDRPQKLEYIKKALNIDPGLAEAHASLGYQLMCKQDWTASERELNRAKELNPNYAQAYAWNGMRLTMIGRYDDAMAEIDRALAMEPTANGINFYKAVTLLTSGKRNQAINQFKQIQEMDPTFSWAHGFLGRVLYWNGDLVGSAEERARAVELDGNPDGARRMREAFASGGWQAFVTESKKLGRGGFAADLGEVDEERVLGNLQRQVETGSFWLFLIRVDPVMDPLRDNPRFQEVLKRFDPPSNG